MPLIKDCLKSWISYSLSFHGSQMDVKKTMGGIYSLMGASLLARKLLAHTSWAFKSEVEAYDHTSEEGGDSEKHDS